MIEEQQLLQSLQLITPESGFDAYTIEHQKQVARISNVIAGKMGLSDDQRPRVILGAAFHDIGKIFTPASILAKPGKLSDAEFELIKKHCFDGGWLLREVGIDSRICEIILQHHERMDGSGYPYGLSGAQISPGARIVAVADVFDAMTHVRPYRPALSVDVTLDEMKTGKGTLYDPEVVDTICSMLTTGEERKIHANNREAIKQSLSG